MNTSLINKSLLSLWRYCRHGLFFSAVISQVHASYSLVNNFDDIGATVWHKNAHGNGTAQIIEDPILSPGSGNNVIAANGGTIINSNTRVFTAIPTIADGTTGTLFFRFATGESLATVTGFLGASTLQLPLTDNVTTLDGYAYGNNKAHINFTAAGALEYRNAAIFPAPTVVADRGDMVWYNVWMVLNNTANTSSLYMQGGDMASQTLLAENFAFRTGVAGEDIHSFFFMASAGASAPTTNGFIYVDDIYVDTTGANLINPTAVPEPSTYAILFGALTLAFVFIKRRK